MSITPTDRRNARANIRACRALILLACTRVLRSREYVGFLASFVDHFSTMSRSITRDDVLVDSTVTFFTWKKLAAINPLRRQSHRFSTTPRCQSHNHDYGMPPWTVADCSALYPGSLAALSSLIDRETRVFTRDSAR